MSGHTHGYVKFTAEVAEAILNRLAAGEPLLRICGPGRGEGMEDRLLPEAAEAANPKRAFDVVHAGAKIAAIMEAARRRVLAREGRDPDHPDCQDPIEVLRGEPAFIERAAQCRADDDEEGSF